MFAVYCIAEILACVGRFEAIPGNSVDVIVRGWRLVRRDGFYLQANKCKDQQQQKSGHSRRLVGSEGVL